jgi:hypothetical protein
MQGFPRVGLGMHSPSSNMGETRRWCLSLFRHKWGHRFFRRSWRVRTSQGLLGSACSWMGDEHLLHMCLWAQPPPLPTWWLQPSAQGPSTHTASCPHPRRGWYPEGQFGPVQTMFCHFTRGNPLTKRVAPHEVCGEPDSYVWQGSHITCRLT